MTVLVCRQEAGVVWIENAAGGLVAPGFFKTAEETEDELQAMGYPRLLTAYPAAQIVAGPGMDPGRAGRGLSGETAGTRSDGGCCRRGTTRLRQACPRSGGRHGRHAACRGGGWLHGQGHAASSRRAGSSRVSCIHRPSLPHDGRRRGHHRGVTRVTARTAARDALGSGMLAQSPGLPTSATACFSILLTTKRTTRRAGTAAAAPVLGLRATRARFACTCHVPKRRRSTGSPAGALPSSWP